LPIIVDIPPRNMTLSPYEEALACLEPAFSINYNF
jgi:hypothetical protein